MRNAMKRLLWEYGNRRTFAPDKSSAFFGRKDKNIYYKQ